MIKLSIPFSEKDRAKDLARNEGTPIRWDPDQKFWYFPGESLPTCLQEFADSPSRENPHQKTERTNPPKPKGPQVLAVDYTYMPFAKAAGAKWNKDLKVCTFEGKTLPIELTGFEPLPYSWEAWAQEELTGDRIPPKPCMEKPLIPRKDQETAIQEILKTKASSSPGFLLADEVGLGKEQSINSPILTPTGWKKLGELRLGENIIGGSSSKIQQVTGIHPQGKKLLYRITFNDKTFTLCGEEHLWNVRDDNHYRRNQGWKTLTTKKLLEGPLTIRPKNPLAKWEIPLPPKIEFPKKKLPLHPYLLGTLLGNGCLINTPSISTRHPEQLDKIKPLLPQGVHIIGPYPSDPNKYHLSSGKKSRENPLTCLLKKTGVYGKIDHQKSVPHDYLFSCSKNRILLLQGLMDTDGGIPNPGRIRFSSSSLQLAEDVAFLSRSLGGWATIHTTSPRPPRSPLPNYTVAIQLPTEQTFSLQYHLDRQTPPKKRPKRTIISIVPEKEEEAICITTNDPKRLYITDDLIVTHNTISAWESILQMDPKKEKRILILAPLGVLSAWRSTIERMGDGKNRVLLLNYDKLKKIYELAEGAKAKTLKGVARKGKPLEFDVVVLDEAHRLKNPTSARTKLATGLYKEAGFLLWMSATAGQNLLELAYLAPLLAHRTGDRVTEISKDFEAWCKKQGFSLQRGTYGKWSLAESPETNKQVHNLLFKPQRGILGALRRRPQDIEGWPEIQRIAFPVELDHQGRELYNLAWEEFLQAIESGKTTPAGQKNLLASPQGMAGLIRLRQKASTLKVPETCELAIELLENGKQVAISCQYLDPAEKILEFMAKEKIPATRFTGLENPTQKEENRLLYQTEKARVIVFTVEEGISLHAGEKGNTPRVQIDHDPRWSAISAHQIDGRSHRNGTFAPIYWMFLRNTIEERIITRLLDRMASMQEIHGDEKDSLEILKNALLH